MNQELTAETLEEGRVALYQLERQLKERNGLPSSDNLSENNSSKQHSSADRRVMDQLPRITRMNHRLESLGLTVEVRVQVSGCQGVLALTSLCTAGYG